ncbi:fibronectin type III domain-containing protein [Spirillospora sp. NPDC047418]
MKRRLIPLLARCLTLALVLSLTTVLTDQAGSGGRAAAAPRSPALAAKAADPASPQAGQFYSVRGRAAGPLDIAAGATATVKVAGVAGVPASGAATVALNLASKGTSAAGSLVVFPSGAAEPGAVASAYRGDIYVHNLVTAKVGADGQVKIANRGGGVVRVYVDLYGYTLSQAGTAAGSVYVALPGSSLLGRTDIEAGATYTFRPLGKGGIPNSLSVTHIAVTVNAGSSGTGKITFYPSGTARPALPNLDFSGNNPARNFVIVPVGDDGEVTISATGAAATIYVDVAGYYVKPSTTRTGAVAQPLQPTRIATNVSIGEDSSHTFAPLGKGGVPTDPGVWAVGINVIVKGNAGTCCYAVMVNDALTVEYAGSATASGYTTAKIGDNGTINVRNAGPAVTVQIDVFAYYSGPTEPGAPSDVTGTPRHQAVQLTWQPPSEDGGTPITGYKVTASPGGATATTSGETTATVRGLENGRAYTFTVTATNLVGTGPPSAPSAAITPVAGRVPGQPTAVTGTPGHGQIKVSWKAPADDGDDAITRYTVTAAPGGEIVRTHLDETEATVTGLVNGTPYAFTVTATNGIGTGPASAPSDLVAPEPPRSPGKPLITEVFPRDGAVRVSWSPPETGSSGLTGYRVITNPGGGTTAVEPDKTEATITGLTNDEPYTFSLVAINDFGHATSRASDPVTPVAADVPLPPPGLMTTPLGGRIDVQWVEPPDGGAPVTGYKLTAEPGGHAVDVPAGTTVAPITGLTNGTAYLVKVVATNKAGDSRPSEQADVVPDAARPPGAPREIQAGVTATGSVALNWSVPDDTGTAPITGYTVTAAPGGSTATTTGTTATMTGLDPATQYTFTVRAANTHGAGSPSAATDPLTPKLTVTANPLVVLSEASVKTLRAAHKDGTLYFEEPTPQVTALTVGSIVVITPTGKVPDGVFRTITGVTRRAGLLILSARRAALNEAVIDGGFSMDAFLGARDTPQLEALAPGVRIRRPTIRGKTVDQGAPSGGVTPRGVSAGIRDGSLVLEFSFATGPDKKEGRVGKVEAWWTFTPHIRPRVWVSAGKTYMDSHLSLAYADEYRVKLGIGSDFDITKKFAKLKFSRKLLYYVPPLWVQPTFNLAVNVKGEISGGVSVALQHNREVGAHIWKDDTGVHFEKIDREGSNKGWHADFYLDASVHGAVLAEFTLIFDEIGGPGVAVGPYLEAKADTTQNPWWEVRIGIRVDAYLRLSPLFGEGEGRLDGIINLFWTILHAGGPFIGLTVEPARTETDVNVPVAFTAKFAGIPPGPVEWKVTSGPGTIDGNGRFVSSERGTSEITATSAGYSASALVYVLCRAGTLASTDLAADGPDPGVSPSAPSGVTAAPGPASATVSWTPPGRPGPLPVREYAIVTSPATTTTYVRGDVTTAVINGLSPYQKYHFTVYALNDAAMSPASEPGPGVEPGDSIIPIDTVTVTPSSTVFGERPPARWSSVLLPPVRPARECCS